MALTTIVKQRRAGKRQSSRDHKAELDKLEQTETSMCTLETNGLFERRSPLPGQSEEGTLGGRLQQVGGRARHGWLGVLVAQLGALETVVWLQ